MITWLKWSGAIGQNDKSIVQCKWSGTWYRCSSENVGSIHHSTCSKTGHCITVLWRAAPMIMNMCLQMYVFIPCVCVCYDSFVYCTGSCSTGTFTKYLCVFNTALQNGTYEVVGKVLAYCLVNRGPAPNFLHSMLYTTITEGADKAKPTVSDIVDLDMRKKMKMVGLTYSIASEKLIERMMHLIVLVWNTRCTVLQRYWHWLVC